MNRLSLVLRYLQHRALATSLTIITFAAGIAVIVALVLINTQVQADFDRNLKGIDLVVSGKGSPLQIILSTMFHIDTPTGNIPIQEAQALEQNPMVAHAIPMALGDNYNGFRIVGTNADYVAHYHGEIAQGRFYTQQMEAVLGSDVAAHYPHAIGDKIIGAHGLVNSDDLHTDFPYTIVGILKPTGSVLDRLVLTPVESVWHVHEHPDADDPEEVAYKHEHPENELTALLIQYRSPLAVAQLPRMINKNSAMQAAVPAFEVARLSGFMGVGADTLRVFGFFLMGLAGASIFAALYQAMDERRYDLALMRSFGASPGKLAGMVLLESLLVASIGVVLGLLVGHGLVELAARWLSAHKHITISGGYVVVEEAYLLAAALVIAALAALIPALRVYRIDIFRTLARG